MRRGYYAPEQLHPHVHGTFEGVADIDMVKAIPSSRSRLTRDQDVVSVSHLKDKPPNHVVTQHQGQSEALRTMYTCVLRKSW